MASASSAPSTVFGVNPSGFHKFTEPAQLKRVDGNHYIVTGAAGFIGSHLVDKLFELGAAKVTILDNLLSGNMKHVNKKAKFIKCDIRNFDEVKIAFDNAEKESHEANKRGLDAVFHLAAIPRTPWCIDDPILAYQTNVMGSCHILEACRLHKIHRVVITSSNVVYAFNTPYRTTKEAIEGLARTYTDMYGLSVVALRNSNVYGTRQSERGPSPNVFAALRASKRSNGWIYITGDGEQSRDFTHVNDIVLGHILASQRPQPISGVYDLCTGVNHTMNEVAKFFACPVKYGPDRPGDIKHITQDPKPAFEDLGFKATVQLKDGIYDNINDKDFD